MNPFANYNFTPPFLQLPLSRLCTTSHNQRWTHCPALCSTLFIIVPGSVIIAPYGYSYTMHATRCTRITLYAMDNLYYHAVSITRT